MTARTRYWVLGVLLLLLGVFLPREWYDSLPWHAELPPPPFKGVTLLQICFILEGLVLIWFSRKRWLFTRVSDAERLPIAASFQEREADRNRTYFWLLIGTTGLALFLRLWRLSSDLWLDEITPLLDYGPLSVLQVIGSYLSSNNHLLNTLLTKLTVGLFGEQEWAVRLPAALFGAATIPAIYWVARRALSRRVSLGITLLLAVSYHHIFFSQNARGYSAYLFFSLLATGLFVKGLQEDRAGIWALYILTMFLNFASLLISVFVFASHILVGGVWWFLVTRRGVSPRLLFKRLLAVFAVTGFLGFQLYALIVPQAYVVMKTTYKNPSAGFSPFTAEFLQELTRGISAGFGAGAVLGVLLFLLIAGVGFLILFQRNWALALSLALPGVLTGIFLVARGLVVSPRFFLLALPLAMMAAVQGINSLATRASDIMKQGRTFSRYLATALVLAACALSLISLRHYYSVPKQAYRASIEYLEGERKPGEIVIVVHLAEMGYHFYGKRYALREGTDYFFVRSVEALEMVLTSHADQRSYLVTTFPRATRIRYPDLAARIAEGWTIARTFRATIGDGAISIWEQRHP